VVSMNGDDAVSDQSLDVQNLQTDKRITVNNFFFDTHSYCFVDTGCSQIDTSRSQIDTGRSQIDTSCSQIDTGRSQIDTDRSQFLCYSR